MMRPLTPTEASVLREAIAVESGAAPSRACTDAEIAAFWALHAVGRAATVPSTLFPGVPRIVVTAAGREALRIYEWMAVGGIT